MGLEDCESASEYVTNWVVPSLYIFILNKIILTATSITTTTIIIIIISFMQGIYTYIPETNYVPREYTVAAVLLLLFMVLILLLAVLNLLYFTLVLSELCVQCPIWLFSVVP